MHNRKMALLAMAVAISGFALAVFIPAASAQRARANSYTESSTNGYTESTTSPYTQYCETYTEYSQYSQYGEYCEGSTTTTVHNGTTTVNVSPGFAISPGSTPGSALGGATSTPLPAGVALLANGSAVINVADLKPGETFTANGVKIKVLKYIKGGVEVSFGGVDVDVPDGATVVISKSGTVNVTYFTSASGAVIPALKKVGASAFHTPGAVGDQIIILKSGKKSNRFSYVLPKGVTFGAHTTWPEIAKVFAVEVPSGKAALRRTQAAAKMTVMAVKAAANKPRSAFTVRLAKPERAFVIKFNTAKLQYSAAEQSYITKNKIKTLSPQFTVKIIAGKTFLPDRFAFSYPV